MRALKLSFRSLLICSALALPIQPALAQTSPPQNPVKATLSDQKAQQLLDFAKVWRDLKYLHTGPAYQQRDWDQAFITTAAKFKAAQNSAELRLALTEFMADLHDPAFSLSPPRSPRAHLLQAAIQLRWLAADTAYLSMPDLGAAFQSDYFGHPQLDSALQQAQQAIAAQAQNLIIDLRQAQFSSMPESQFANWLSLWFSRDLDLPQQQSRQHIGYPSQTRESSGGFFSRVVSSTPASIKARGQRDLKLVFIVNYNTPVAESVLALRQHGQAAIISVGEPNFTQISGRMVRRVADIPMFYGLYHLQFAGNDDGKLLDLQLQETAFTKMTQADLDQTAINLVAKLNASPTVTATPTNLVAKPNAMPAESAYAGMVLPELAWRELAVIKLWAVMDSFFPYMDLLPAQTWENASKQALQEMQEVSQVRDYEHVLKRMLAPLSDSHIGINNLGPITSYRVWPAVTFAYAEDQVVVKTLEDPQLLAAGITPGDVLIKFADLPVKTRLDHLRKLISASTLANSYRDALNFLLVGAPDSQVKLQFRKPNASVVELNLRREYTTPSEVAATPAHYAINQQLAYINLASISEDELSKAITQYKNYPALILDLRVYPRLQPYIFAKIFGADRPQNLTFFRTPILGAETAFGEKLSREFHQKAYQTNSEKCRQPKIVLINEMTQSRAEHIGLFIKELCPTVFIGRPSAGTNGDATWTVLPGNIEVQFSGQAVMHADGTQLQGLGLQPAVVVKPTIADLRSGIDAELAAAINYGMQHYVTKPALSKTLPPKK